MIRKTSKTNTCVVCKVCNCKRTTIYRNKDQVGWPPKGFDVLNAEKKREFWNSVKETKDTKHLLEVTKEYVDVFKTSTKASVSHGEYQPIGWYKKQGYNTKRIKSKCKDKKYDPILGTLYRVYIAKQANSTVEGKSRHQYTGLETPQSAPMLAASVPVPGASREELKKAREERKNIVSAAREQQKRFQEEVRQSKAVAAQEARLNKQSQSRALAVNRSISSAMFALKQTMNQKLAKSIPAEEAEKIKKCQTHLDEIDKECQGFLSGKLKGVVSVNLSKESVKAAEKAAHDWANRVSQYCASIALQPNNMKAKV